MRHALGAQQGKNRRRIQREIDSLHINKVRTYDSTVSIILERRQGIFEDAVKKW